MIVSEQLTFDGGAEPYPLRHVYVLTTRQRDLLRYMRWLCQHGSPMATREARKFYADPGGALRRLEALGLVRHCTGRGCWKPTP